jgi:hypothetical protein
MARQFALLRAFRQLETRRVTVGALIAVTVVAGIAVAVGLTRPGWVVTILGFIAAGVIFAIVTFGVAALLRPRRQARALELYRWVGRWDWLRWRKITGVDVPNTPGRARAWLESQPAVRGAGDVARVEMLVWVGEFDTARRVAASLPIDTPGDRFERELQLAFVDFVATGDGDLEAPRAALAELVERERRVAQASLAVEAARRRAAAGEEFMEPLLAARESFGSELDGFLLPDLARWVAWPLLIVGWLSALTTFIVVAALPGR